MTPVSLHQFLVLYSWFPLAALLFFLLLIGRFYQKFSGVQTYFWVYIVAMIIYGAAVVRYAGVGIVLGDALADVLYLIGGLLLLCLVGVLYYHMMRETPS